MSETQSGLWYITQVVNSKNHPNDPYKKSRKVVEKFEKGSLSQIILLGYEKGEFIGPSDFEHLNKIISGEILLSPNEIVALEEFWGNFCRIYLKK